MSRCFRLQRCNGPDGFETPTTVSISFLTSTISHIVRLEIVVQLSVKLVVLWEMVYEMFAKCQIVMATFMGRCCFGIT